MHNQLAVDLYGEVSYARLSLQQDQSMQQELPSRTIQGRVVARWNDDIHLFEIEELPTPRMVGAGLRPYRLWCDGSPALGGQWHYDIDSARARAEYLVQGSLASRNNWLSDRVTLLERLLRTSRQLHTAYRRQVNRAHLLIGCVASIIGYIAGRIAPHVF